MSIYRPTVGIELRVRRLNQLRSGLRFSIKTQQTESFQMKYRNRDPRYEMSFPHR